MLMEARHLPRELELEIPQKKYEKSECREGVRARRKRSGIPPREKRHFTDSPKFADGHQGEVAAMMVAGGVVEKPWPNRSSLQFRSRKWITGISTRASPLKFARSSKCAGIRIGN